MLSKVSGKWHCNSNKLHCFHYSCRLSSRWCRPNRQSCCRRRFLQRKPHKYKECSRTAQQIRYYKRCRWLLRFERYIQLNSVGRRCIDLGSILTHSSSKCREEPPVYSRNLRHTKCIELHLNIMNNSLDKFDKHCFDLDILPLDRSLECKPQLSSL